MDTEITFVKTRWFYQSYTDFWKLVDLSGFKTIYVDELDASKDGVYITCPMNGEWRPHLENQANRERNAHLILWNLERPSGSAGYSGEYSQKQRRLMYGLQDDGTPAKCRFIDEVWVSDRQIAAESGMRFVVLGSDEGLGEPGTDKVFDLCHMSYEVDRRRNIYRRFDKVAPNAWPPERDTILKQSKFALNIHQDRHPFQEPLRFALFAAYGLPIITETIFDSYPWSDEYMVYSEWDDMVRKVREILSQPYDRYQEMGFKARERMCKQFRFKDMVEQAVEESVGSWR